MATTPSLKNVSVAQLQKEIARALCEVTGFCSGSVTIESLQFEKAELGEERARLQISVTMCEPHDPTIPF